MLGVEKMDISSGGNKDKYSLAIVGVQGLMCAHGHCFRPAPLQQSSPLGHRRDVMHFAI